MDQYFIYPLFTGIISGTSCSQEIDITSSKSRSLSSHQQSSDPIIRSSLSEVREGEELPELELDVMSINNMMTVT